MNHLAEILAMLDKCDQNDLCDWLMTAPQPDPDACSYGDLVFLLIQQVREVLGE